MQPIFENNFLIIEFDEETKLIQPSWKENTENMEEEDVKSAISIFVNLLEKYKSSLILSDDSNRKCIYTIEMQKWVADTIVMGAIQAKVSKYALIMPHDLITSISTEQTVDEIVELPFQLNYFEDTESAKKWLLE